jgi:glycosyltransferase involved in cell wall biosynthesis
MSKTTILMTAYAVHPHKGSEDGMGWRFILAAARKHRVIAITRVNNGPAIETFLANNDFEGHENLQFVYFDLPTHLRFWKRGGRFSSLYHWIWHASLPNFIKKKGFGFDIAHHVNFHCDWTPSQLWRLGKPFVWGPIGHHPQLPKDYLLETGGTKAWIVDRLKWYSKAVLWQFSPALSKSVKMASTVFVMNSGVQKVLKLKENQIKVMPSVGCSVELDLTKRNCEKNSKGNAAKFTILFMGRFEVLKSPETVLRSFAVFYHNLEEKKRKNVVLKMVGKGSLLLYLQNLSKELAIENAVEWTNWVAFEQINTIYQSCSLFFFPSHEGAGMVVAEALAQGLPVLCYANEGPGELTDESCAIRIPYTTHLEAIRKFAWELDCFYQNPNKLEIMGRNARGFVAKNLSWEYKSLILEEVYANVLKEVNSSNEVNSSLFLST